MGKSGTKLYKSDNLGSGFTHILRPGDVYFPDIWGAETSPFGVPTLSSGTWHVTGWFRAYWQLMEIAWASWVGSSVSMNFKSCNKRDEIIHQFLSNMIQGWSWIADKKGWILYTLIFQTNYSIHDLTGWDLTPGLTLMYRKCPASHEVAPQESCGAHFGWIYFPIQD